MVPSPTAAARVPGRWSAAPDDRAPDDGRQPDRPGGPTAPMAPCAEARPSRSTSSGSSSGRRNRSTAGKRRARPGPVALAHGAAGEHDPQRRVGRLELRQLALPADHLLLGGLADRAGVDDHEVGRLERRRLGAARPRAGGRPSPRSRSGSSGSRASRSRSSAAPPARGGTPRRARRRRRPDPRAGRRTRRHDVEDGQRAGGRSVDHRSEWRSWAIRSARWGHVARSRRGPHRRRRSAPRVARAPRRTTRGRHGSRCLPWARVPSRCATAATALTVCWSKRW